MKPRIACTKVLEISVGTSFDLSSFICKSVLLTERA